MALTIPELVEEPVAALGELAAAFDRKPPPSSRTCRTWWLDAVAVNAGDTHRAQAAAIRRMASGLTAAAARLSEVAIGATAVGTGIGAPRGLRQQCAAILASLTGRSISSSGNLLDAWPTSTRAARSPGRVRAAITMAKNRPPTSGCCPPHRSAGWAI
jgi:aspartate ammonia-lyase